MAMAEKPAPAAHAEKPAPAANASVADSTKAEQKPEPSKKKFNFRAGLKKVGPIRLVNGFRSKLRPKIALDSQKDVADNVREWLYERRNKYEKFVDNVLGKATPVGVKKPAEKEETEMTVTQTVSVIPGAVPAVPGIPAPAQRDPVRGKSIEKIILTTK